MQLQRFFFSPDGSRTKTRVETDQSCVVMHGKSKHLGTRDLTGMEKRIFHKNASDIPRQRITPKDMGRMAKKLVQ